MTDIDEPQPPDGMASPKKPIHVPSRREFRARSNLYVHFPWYSVAVQEGPGDVVVTLAPTNWRRAVWWSGVIAIVWSLALTASWLQKPVPLNAARVVIMSAAVCLSPLHLPLLRWLTLRRHLPWLRLDKSQGVVQLFAGSRQLPISDVVAICDVIVPGMRGSNRQRVPRTYEMQLLLRGPRGTEFILLVGGWHASAQKRFAPITSDIAKRLGIPHYSVDAVAGTITENGQSGPLS